MIPAMTCVILACMVWWQRRHITRLSRNTDYLRQSLRRAEYQLYVQIPRPHRTA